MSKNRIGSIWKFFHEEDEIVETMGDERELIVEITIKDAWLLISALQLATRHPELSTAMKDNLFSTARQFQTVIESIHPGAHELLDMGWNTKFDDVDSLDEYDGVIPDRDDDWDDGL